MLRLTRAWHLAGVKNYDEDREEERVTRISSLKKKKKLTEIEIERNCHNLYENGEFLKEMENLYNAENVDDGYEMILVKNSSKEKDQS